MDPLSLLGSMGGGFSPSFGSGASGGDEQQGESVFTGGTINTGNQNNPYLIGGLILAAVVAIAVIVK